METNLKGVTLHDIVNGFPMIQSLLFEVLRLKGPGASLFLEPGEPVEIQGCVVKPRTVICAALTQTLGADAAAEIPLGPNGEGPKQFCPHRWLVRKQDGRLTVVQLSNKNGGFVQFGYSARACPGAQLAKIEAITALCCIVHRFEIEPIANHPEKSGA